MKKAYLPYNKDLKQFSRNLRNHSTLGEVLLWKYLKASGMMGYKFNRQKPLSDYIADFYCKKLNLVIEVDGSSHNDKEEYDARRDKVMQEMDLFILRVSYSDVKNDIYSVLKEIEKTISQLETKHGVKKQMESPSSRT